MPVTPPVTVVTPFELPIAGTDAVLNTAISKYVTAMNLAVSETMLLANVVPLQIQIVPGDLIWNGTLYTVKGSLLYKTAVTTP